MKGYSLNSNVRKERAVILMFERIGTKSNVKKDRARKSNVREERAGIPMLKRTGPRIQC